MILMSQEGERAGVWRLRYMYDGKVSGYSVKRGRSGRKMLGERFDFPNAWILDKGWNLPLSYGERDGEPRVPWRFVWRENWALVFQEEHVV